MSETGLYQLQNFQERDAFYWYCRMDMASTVAALHADIITPANAALTAKGIQSVIVDAAQPGAERPTDYLGVQPLLLKKTGPEGSRMHSGRSRQDMLAVLHRFLLRDRLLAVFEKLNCVRAAMIALGEKYHDALIPAYTNGVQAQPVTFGFLLNGYESALRRSAQRLIECYFRLNQSPLGAAALATSRFPVDRPFLAELLGFHACVENAFDAAQIAIVDVGVETAQHAALIALSLGTFIQDIHVQFHHAHNWIFLDADGNISPSTLMPQKRNPVVLNRARLLGSEVVGQSVTAALSGHNVNSGMTDYKRANASRALELVLLQMNEVLDVLRGIRLDKEAALAEINAEFSTTSDLAAALQEQANVPYATGHKFASILVDYCRREKCELLTLPFNDVQELYSKAAEQTGIAPRFPLSDIEFRIAVSAQTMVEGYRGLGGSSPDEVRRMLASAKAALNEDEVWLEQAILSLVNAEQELEAKFNALITP